jgi:uncharacterized protein
MKIGILSDTHDDLDSVRKAVTIFNERKVSFVMHAGDYIFPGVIDEFRELHNAKLLGVLGNNDGEKIGLFRKFESLGEIANTDFLEKEIDGLKFAVYHGTSKELTEALIRSGLYDIFIYGHTHKPSDERVGRTQVLNPGTTHADFPNIDGRIEKEPRVIIYDTTTRGYEFVNLIGKATQS